MRKIDLRPDDERRIEELSLRVSHLGLPSPQADREANLLSTKHSLDFILNRNRNSNSSDVYSSNLKGGKLNYDRILTKSFSRVLLDLRNEEEQDDPEQSTGLNQGAKTLGEDTFSSLSLYGMSMAVGDVNDSASSTRYSKKTNKSEHEMRTRLVAPLSPSPCAEIDVLLNVSSSHQNEVSDKLVQTKRSPRGKVKPLASATSGKTGLRMNANLHRLQYSGASSEYLNGLGNECEIEDMESMLKKGILDSSKGIKYSSMVEELWKYKLENGDIHHALNELVPSMPVEVMAAHTGSTREDFKNSKKFNRDPSSGRLYTSKLSSTLTYAEMEDLRRQKASFVSNNDDKKDFMNPKRLTVMASSGRRIYTDQTASSKRPINFNSLRPLASPASESTTTTERPKIDGLSHLLSSLKMQAREDEQTDKTKVSDTVFKSEPIIFSARSKEPNHPLQYPKTVLTEHSEFANTVSGGTIQALSSFPELEHNAENVRKEITKQKLAMVKKTQIPKTEEVVKPEFDVRKTLELNLNFPKLAKRVSVRHVPGDQSSNELKANEIGMVNEKDENQMIEDEGASKSSLPPSLASASTIAHTLQSGLEANSNFVSGLLLAAADTEQSLVYRALALNSNRMGYKRKAQNKEGGIEIRNEKVSYHNSPNGSHSLAQQCKDGMLSHSSEVSKHAVPHLKIRDVNSSIQVDYTPSSIPRMIHEVCSDIGQSYPRNTLPSASLTERRAQFRRKHKPLASAALSSLLKQKEGYSHDQTLSVDKNPTNISSIINAIETLRGRHGMSNSSSNLLSKREVAKMQELLLHDQTMESNVLLPKRSLSAKGDLALKTHQSCAILKNVKDITAPQNSEMPITATATLATKTEGDNKLAFVLPYPKLETANIIESLKSDSLHRMTSSHNISSKENYITVKDRIYHHSLKYRSFAVLTEEMIGELVAMSSIPKRKNFKKSGNDKIVTSTNSGSDSGSDSGEEEEEEISESKQVSRSLSSQDTLSLTTMSTTERAEAIKILLEGTFEEATSLMLEDDLALVAMRLMTKWKDRFNDGHCDSSIQESSFYPNGNESRTLQLRNSMLDLYENLRRRAIECSERKDEELKLIARDACVATLSASNLPFMSDLKKEMNTPSKILRAYISAILSELLLNLKSLLVSEDFFEFCGTLPDNSTATEQKVCQVYHAAEERRSKIEKEVSSITSKSSLLIARSEVDRIMDKFRSDVDEVFDLPGVFRIPKINPSITHDIGLSALPRLSDSNPNEDEMLNVIITEAEKAKAEAEEEDRQRNSDISTSMFSKSVNQSDNLAEDKNLKTNPDNKEHTTKNNALTLANSFLSSSLPRESAQVLEESLKISQIYDMKPTLSSVVYLPKPWFDLTQDIRMENYRLSQTEKSLKKQLKQLQNELREYEQEARWVTAWHAKKELQLGLYQRGEQGVRAELELLEHVQEDTWAELMTLDQDNKHLVSGLTCPGLAIGGEREHDFYVDLVERHDHSKRLGELELLIKDQATARSQVAVELKLVQLDRAKLLTRIETLEQAVSIMHHHVASVENDKFSDSEDEDGDDRDYRFALGSTDNARSERNTSSKKEGTKKQTLNLNDHDLDGDEMGLLELEDVSDPPSTACKNSSSVFTFNNSKKKEGLTASREATPNAGLTLLPQESSQLGSESNSLRISKNRTHTLNTNTPHTPHTPHTPSPEVLAVRRMSSSLHIDSDSSESSILWTAGQKPQFSAQPSKLKARKGESKLSWLYSALAVADHADASDYPYKTEDAESLSRIQRVDLPSNVQLKALGTTSASLRRLSSLLRREPTESDLAALGIEFDSPLSFAARKVQIPSKSLEHLRGDPEGVSCYKLDEDRILDVEGRFTLSKDPLVSLSELYAQQNHFKSLLDESMLISAKSVKRGRRTARQQRSQKSSTQQVLTVKNEHLELSSWDETAKSANVQHNEVKVGVCEHEDLPEENAFMIEKAVEIPRSLLQGIGYEGEYLDGCNPEELLRKLENSLHAGKIGRRRGLEFLEEGLPYLSKQRLREDDHEGLKSGNGFRIPLFLEFDGFVRDSKMRKIDAEVRVKEIWSLKALADQRASHVSARPTSLHKFFEAYCRSRTGNNPIRAVWFGTNLIVAMQRDSTDPDFRVFLSVLFEMCSEQVQYDQTHMVHDIRDTLFALEASPENRALVCLRPYLLTLSSFQDLPPQKPHESISTLTSVVNSSSSLQSAGSGEEGREGNSSITQEEQVKLSGSSSGNEASETFFKSTLSLDSLPVNDNNPSSHRSYDDLESSEPANNGLPMSSAVPVSEGRDEEDIWQHAAAVGISASLDNGRVFDEDSITEKSPLNSPLLASPLETPNHSRPSSGDNLFEKSASLIKYTDEKPTSTSLSLQRSDSNQLADVSAVESHKQESDEISAEVGSIELSPLEIASLAVASSGGNAETVRLLGETLRLDEPISLLGGGRNETADARRAESVLNVVMRVRRYRGSTLPHTQTQREFIEKLMGSEGIGAVSLPTKHQNGQELTIFSIADEFQTQSWLHKDFFAAALRLLFPNKTEDRVLELLTVASRDAMKDDFIALEQLLNFEDSEGYQSNFMELIRDQDLEELFEYFFSDIRTCLYRRAIESTMDTDSDSDDETLTTLKTQLTDADESHDDVLPFIERTKKKLAVELAMQAMHSEPHDKQTIEAFKQQTLIGKQRIPAAGDAPSFMSTVVRRKSIFGSVPQLGIPSGAYHLLSSAIRLSTSADESKEKVHIDDYRVKTARDHIDNVNDPTSSLIANLQSTRKRAVKNAFLLSKSRREGDNDDNNDENVEEGNDKHPVSPESKRKDEIKNIADSSLSPKSGKKRQEKKRKGKGRQALALLGDSELGANGTYTIGNSHDQVVLPFGFITRRASIAGSQSYSGTPPKKAITQIFGSNSIPETSFSAKMYDYFGKTEASIELDHPDGPWISVKDIVLAILDTDPEKPSTEILEYIISGTGNPHVVCSSLVRVEIFLNVLVLVPGSRRRSGPKPPPVTHPTIDYELQQTHNNAEDEDTESSNELDSSLEDEYEASDCGQQQIYAGSESQKVDKTETPSGFVSLSDQVLKSS